MTTTYFTSWIGRLGAAVLLLLLPGLGWGQTNPTAYNLSLGSYTFSSFASGSITAYPASMQGHTVSTEPTSTAASPYLTPAPSGSDEPLAPNTDAIGNLSIRNETTNGISFANTGGKKIGELTLALNTTGRTSVQVAWTGRSLNSGARTYGVQLQYRVGITGNFTDVTSNHYQSDGTAADANYTTTLPVAVENNAVVQLRWLYANATATTGSRPRLGVDDITVSSSASVPTATLTPTSTLTSFATNFASASAEQSYTLDGSNLTAGGGTITVTPPAGYQLSTTSGSYATSAGTAITFTYSGNSFTGKTIYVRLAAGLPATAYAGNITNAGGGATTANVAVTGAVAPTLTEVLVPQYAVSNTGSNRVPYGFLVTLSNLTPGVNYNYYTKAVANGTSPNTASAGNSIFANKTGSFTLTTSPGLVTAGTYGTFAASATGTYTGWFVLETSGNPIFNSAALIQPTITLNDGASGTTSIGAVATPSSVKCLALAATAADATGLYGTTAAPAKSFVASYDNTSAGSPTNRPLYASFVENDGVAETASYAAFYTSNVDGQTGRYGLITPNTNANGIRRLEQRALADGSLVCANTSATGTWPSGTNTVNPSGGTTALVLTATDAPLAAVGPVTLGTNTGQVGDAVTITGSNFVAGSGNTTVSFNGTAATVVNVTSATSLTATVPSGATTGPVLVNTTSTCSTAQSGGTYTVTVPATPTLVVSPTSLSGFTYVAGSGPSAEQTYSLSGSTLTAGPITVTAPTGYEVSLTSGTGYAASVSVTYTVPTLGNTTIFVRLKSGLAVNATYAGNVTNAGGGATTQNVAVSGSVTAPVPVITVNPTSLALGTVAVNTPGTISSYTVSGSNLGSTAISITAPANVELSLNGFVTSASTTLSLTPTAGSVASTTVSVRIAATASAAPISGNIANTSGATTSNVAVSGSVAASGTACFPAESFEGSVPPAGWVGVVTAGTNTPRTGAVQAEFGTVNSFLTTPALANPTSITFYLYRTNNATAKNLLVQVSTTSQSSGFTTLLTIDNTTTAQTAYTPFTVDLSAYNASSTVYVRFFRDGTGSTSPWRLDDVSAACGAAAPAFTLATGTPSVAAPYCVGQSPAGDVAFNLPYTVSGGSFGTGNVFTAYLSDATGSFATNKKAVGTVTAVSSGTIAVVLAQFSTPFTLTTASAYRLRVEASTAAAANPTLVDNGPHAVTSYLDNEASTSALNGNGQATLNFTAPATCAQNVVVTIKQGTSFGTKPVANGTYTPGAGGSTVVFGTGTDLGGGQYVVYNGLATGSIVVTGLTNGTQYAFGTFVTNGGTTSATGYSNGTQNTVRPVAPATLTEVVVPQLISARTTASTHTTRLPYVWRVTLGNLTANTTYKYYTSARVTADVAGSSGSGIPIETKVAGTFVRGTGPGLSGTSSTFMTDATGSFTGWFGLEPTADARFAAGTVITPQIVINPGDGSNVESQYLATSSGVTATLLGTAAANATGVRGASFGTASNFVLIYDNTAGTGRPLAGTWLESDGVTETTNYVAYYGSNVDGVAGAWGLLTPNTNANGIRRVEQRSLTTGAVVGCAATSATGTWTGAGNTVNPAGGTTPLVFTTGDAPFAAPTVLDTFTPNNAVVGTTITVNGTNFTTGPVPTVSFNGGTAVNAATVNAAGNSLTVVVPAGASSGPLTVTTACGPAATTTASFTVVPTVFYTKATGDVNVLATYGSNPDGSGTAPTSFAGAGLIFNLTGTGRTFSTGDFTVSGTGAKVVLAANATFIIPTTGVYAGTLDQSAGSTLVIQNSGTTAVTGLIQGVQDASSTIDLAQTGAVYLVPPQQANSTGGYYFNYTNLKLTNGQKQIGGNNTTPLVVASNVTFDNTAISGTFTNGGTSPTNYPTIKFGGDFTQLTGTTYDATRSIVLQPSNTTTVQALNANGNTIALYDIYTPSSGTFAGFRLTGTGSVLQLGNTVDGGFALDNGTPLALDAGTLLRLTGAGRFFSGASGTLKPDAGASIEIIRTTDGIAGIGTLPLATGFTTVTNFTLNATAPTATNNILTLGNALTATGTLALTSGTLALNGKVLTANGPLTAGTGVLGGSATSGFVLGGTGTVAALAFASGAQTLNNLTLNRFGATLPLGSPLAVSGPLTLTAGLLATTATNLLTLTTAATISGGNANSYVSGPLARATAASAATVLFPIGKGTAYRPLTLNIGSQDAPRTYVAEQFNASARTTAVTAPLTRVSDFRYFNLTPVAATGNFSGTVTLSFGADDYVNYPQDPSFVVAKRSPSSSPWASIGRSSNTGTSSGSGGPVAGTLTSGTFTTFSDFALASTAPQNNNAFNTLNPLPVELTRFSATRTPKTPAVNLAWATASEKNSARFEVQRSLDGETFALVATVAAQGHSSQPTAYTAADAAAPVAQLYYRLRQVDADGNVAYSPVVPVAALPTALAQIPALWPNPAREAVHVTAPAATPYRVLNLLGQPLLQGRIEAENSAVPVLTLPAGVYYLELQTSTGRVVQKFVKE